MSLHGEVSVAKKLICGFISPLSIACLLICNGCNGVSSPTGTTPPPPKPKVAFAYTANESGSISGYAVNSSTGALTPFSGFPVYTGGNPAFVEHDPQGRFLVATDMAQALVRVYAINPSSGALNEISPSPYMVEKEPKALAFDPSGRFLYVASQQIDSVTAFTVSASGVLSPVLGSPFPTGGTSAFGSAALVAPSGKSLYTSDLNNVYSFQINSATGALTLVSTVAGPNSVGGLALDTSGSRLYAVGSGSNSIESYSIDSTTGALTTASSSPLAMQNGAYTIAIDPAGRFAYTVESSQYLVAYSLTNGSFASIATYTGALGSLQLAIDPTSSFLYAPQTGTDNNVNGFHISSSGTLSSLGPPAPAVQWPMSVTLVSE